MDNKHILGFVGIAIIVIAAAYAGYLVMNDWGGGEGGSDEPVRLEYSLELDEHVDSCVFTLSFTAPGDGWYYMYLGDEILLDGAGEPIQDWFVTGDHVRISYVLGYDEYELIDIKQNLHPVFSSIFDPVRV